jgi:two-component system phosphate regulon response regulator PhoB
MSCILLVCDEASKREFYGAILELAGYQCTYAQNAQDALSVLNIQPVDLLMADFRSNSYDNQWTGFDMFEAMKDEPYCAEMGKMLWLPKIYMTEEGARQLADLQDSLGIHFLVMPVTPKDLLRETEAVLRECHKPLMTEEERRANFERNRIRLMQLYNWTDDKVQEMHKPISDPEENAA